MSSCLLYLSSFTDLFVSTEDPVNSKWILFTAGMVGDYSGFSTSYVIFLGVSLQYRFRAHIKLKLVSFCLLYLFTYLFVSTGDPVNSK